MIIKRIGRCVTCRRPTVEKKEFLVTVDMFDSSAPIRGDLLKQIKEWRESDMHCEADK
jgi:hypothetical protein